MIDNFSLGISHGLMLLAVWLLLRRPDLDRDDAPPGTPAAPHPRPRWRRRVDPDAGDA